MSERCLTPLGTPIGAEVRGIDLSSASRRRSVVSYQQRCKELLHGTGKGAVVQYTDQRYAGPGAPRCAPAEPRHCTCFPEHAMQAALPIHPRKR